MPTVIFEVTLSESREDLYLYDDDDDEIIAQTFQDDEMVYADVAASILLDDWVGPVTAAFEVWKNGGHGQPRLRHGPTVSYSLVLFCIHTDVSYFIVNRTGRRQPYEPGHQFTDIVPPGQREATFDGTRTAELELKLYRKLLNSAKVKCAEGRAYKFLRPRSNELGHGFAG